MLTLKLISEETERVVKGLEKKHFPNAREAVEKVLEYDKIRREAQQKLDNNKQQANQFAKQIGALMKEGKKEEAESAKAQVAMLKADAKALEEIMEKAQNDIPTSCSKSLTFLANRYLRVRMQQTTWLSKKAAKSLTSVQMLSATGIS